MLEWRVLAIWWKSCCGPHWTVSLHCKISTLQNMPPGWYPCGILCRSWDLLARRVTVVPYWHLQWSAWSRRCKANKFGHKHSLAHVVACGPFRAGACYIQHSFTIVRAEYLIIANKIWGFALAQLKSGSWSQSMRFQPRLRRRGQSKTPEYLVGLALTPFITRRHQFHSVGIL